MFDLGWFELGVIGAVLLVVVGPRDLPKVLRTVGIWTGKARRLAREFQRTLDDYARETELDDVKKAVERPGAAKRAARDAIDPAGTLEKDLAGTERELRSSLAGGDDRKVPADKSGEKSGAAPVRDEASTGGAPTGGAA